MRLDRETLSELEAPHERIDKPLSVGLRLSGIALMFFAMAALAQLVRLPSTLPVPDWTWIAIITLGMVANSFAYAYLGARYGRRIARRTVGALLAVVLIIGLYALTRYTSSR